MNMASDRELLLGILRRELANYLVRIDPVRFYHVYRKARTAEEEIEKSDMQTRNAQLLLITNKRPYYTDLDIIGTRDHVLYEDVLSSILPEEIEEHYLDLVKFHAIQRAVNPDWHFRGAATSDESLKHLHSYISKISDTRLRQKLQAAQKEIDFVRYRQRGLGDPNELFETALFAAYRVPHIMETRYGVYFKDGDEYGLISTFYDDERDKTYVNFYRSDRMFQKEEILDDLRLEQRI